VRIDSAPETKSAHKMVRRYRHRIRGTRGDIQHPVILL
jgi:hypothetical protein